MKFPELLKDIYLHELDAREKIFTRLQLNFVVYVTVFTFSTYMVRMFDYDSNIHVVASFYGFFIIGFVFLFISIKYTVNAFTGYEYAVFPSAASFFYFNNLKEYSKSIEKYNVENDVDMYVPIPDSMMSDYITEALTKSIDKNYNINEQRRIINRKALLYLAYASIPIFFSSVIFLSFDLDVSSSRKNLLVKDVGVENSINKVIEFLKK